MKHANLHQDYQVYMYSTTKGDNISSEAIYMDSDSVSIPKNISGVICIDKYWNGEYYMHYSELRKIL